MNVVTHGDTVCIIAVVGTREVRMWPREKNRGLGLRLAGHQHAEREPDYLGLGLVIAVLVTGGVLAVLFSVF